jgi:thiol-disulfide isomerase/thioredoxin
MKRVLILLLAIAVSRVHAEEIEAVDPTGNTVGDYEVMWHTAEQGHSGWNNGGHVDLPRDASVVDLIVRADGYASTVRRFTGKSLVELRGGEAKIVLLEGKEVRLELNLPDGVEPPEDFLPQVYFEQFAWRVRMMWQPVNLGEGRKAPDYNMLNVRKAATGQYVFRLAGDTPEFFIAFNHPGWLRFYEVGPFSDDDVTDTSLKVDVPKPATLTASLPAREKAGGPLPFVNAAVEVYWPNPEMEGSVYSVNNEELFEQGGELVLNDLGPGDYTVSIRTTPKDGVTSIDGTEINPGRYFARQATSLSPGSVEKLQFEWTPFDPNAWRGDGHARLKLNKPNGEPAAGAPVKVSWFDGHYGALDVYDGLVPATGVLDLQEISTTIATESPYGPYAVELDGKTVGWFRLEPKAGPQEFEFKITPEAGDEAPDITFLEIDSNTTHALSDFRGKVVLLELWATWCGPCQPAMEKLNDLANDKLEWGDRVVILPLSVDKRPDLPADHKAERGWTAMRHYWSQPWVEGQSQAEREFVVRGIPTAVLIKPDGTIAWRGHPTAVGDEGVDLQERIEQLLRDK